ncbi:LEAF RUST 10 DISEASE-RESISTANCE LOCUS RECEPTOR-LIKE PROTEIN KINASE-like 1.3 isoform X2 [Diospyros lotus]|uniref:LEAF RUST 10 DISEASE-RESISTANCE LOCUS RECEPTOR-LIKE PROTEIN KINASE-like 1.3 isoform X2 n=1 Tax=Diospyros lotus TaxID=55363 RepID=UPI0022596A16|nr:LEAF RUST 10 DISEASE-RESISTANCE LOCUS RECEPTOR-LIKE PROTEIN KINASE-like 1.3 isoform X2 [Diospyros lotus]
MNSPSPIFSHLSLTPFLLLLFRISSADDGDWLYDSCATTFNCGFITELGYPFRAYTAPANCSYPGLALNCQKDIPTIQIMNLTYRLLNLSLAKQTMVIAREDAVGSVCPQDLVNTTLDNSLFEYSPGYVNLTFFYGCPVWSIPSSLMPVSGCTVPGYKEVYWFLGSVVPFQCKVSVTVPVSPRSGSINSTNLGQVLGGGVEVTWKVNDSACSNCKDSKGRCGFDFLSNQTTCFCPNPPYVSATCAVDAGAPSSESSPRTGDGSGSDSMSMQIGLPIAGAVIAGIGLGWAIFACRQKRKRVAAESAQAAESKDIVSSAPLTKGLTTTPSTNLSHSIPSYRSSKSEFGKASTYFGAQIFSYAELEEATNYFDPSRELGDGGFGTVYYGKLQDGRIVAVKRLYENNFKRVEQFMNEVEILTRLRHVNLVTLYGCTSKRSRELLLVYEFIPNGTVADHLHGRKSNSGLLSWPVRLGIAMETAEALAYLHASDIIHRDVKTNNILLDNDFHVKVADFGLSRLFPNDVTHVSTAPQGTPGYVDPEYYQCYQLTERSDVYSFGVVLIELISSKQAVDTNRDRQEINLANMAINKIQNHTLNELVDPDLGFETNSSVRRMATLVAELAFRCLQMERDMRPSMEEVLKALKRIKNEEMNGGQDAEVVDIVIEDDVGLLKGNPPPLSPDSTATDKRVSNSYTSFSSG